MKTALHKPTPIIRCMQCCMDVFINFFHYTLSERQTNDWMNSMGLFGW